MSGLPRIPEGGRGDFPPSYPEARKGLSALRLPNGRKMSIAWAQRSQNKQLPEGKKLSGVRKTLSSSKSDISGGASAGAFSRFEQMDEAARARIQLLAKRRQMTTPQMRPQSAPLPLVSEGQKPLKKASSWTEGVEHAFLNRDKKQMLKKRFNKLIRPTVREQWGDIRKEAQSPIQDMEEELDMAQKMFNNAFDSHLHCLILGNGNIRSDALLLANFGIVAAESDTEAIKTAKKEMDEDVNAKAKIEVQKLRTLSGRVENTVEDHFQKGSILCDQKWSLLRNDAFILGAVFGGKQFHVALKEITTESFWAPGTDFPLRVFGREIVILCLAGYKLVEDPGGRGIIFMPPDEDHSVTLYQVREAIAKIKSPEQIRDLLAQARAR